MGRYDSTLRHHLGQVVRAELRGEVPPHAENDDSALGVPALEQILPRALRCHQPSSGMRHVCTRTRRGGVFLLPGGDRLIAPGPRRAVDKL